MANLIPLLGALSPVGLLAEIPGAAILNLARVFLVLAVVIGGGFLLLKLLIGLGGLVGKLFQGVARLIGHVFGTLGSIFHDSFRTLGALATGTVLLPLSVGNVALGRWSAARHFWNASLGEGRAAALAFYRVAISHPLRLIGLHGLLEGFEQRLPEVLAEAPGRDRPRGGKRGFEGYEVVGALPPGGSGAKLYRAKPSAQKREQMRSQGLEMPAEVVIKSFDLESGSTLPQIVRENRALQAARSLGLVLEHELSPKRFHYVMPFVPGQDLAQISRGLHARSGPEGLSGASLRAAMGYTAGLLEILERFHGAGLWHKDIKPSNVIVNGDRVELVDLGLVTPLTSALTLTTHGTEYYRDPEMVRLALQGVKVHEVDGVKFDLYSVGAVLFGLLENCFPTHGSLSRITKRCPPALTFVVQRAMTDLKDRYPNARAMLIDLQVLLAASDPYKVRPADLPSMGGAGKPSGQAAAYPVAGGPPPLPHSLDRLAGLAAVGPIAPKGARRKACARRGAGQRGLGSAVAAGLVGVFAMAGAMVVHKQQRLEAAYPAPQATSATIIHTGPGRRVAVAMPSVQVHQVSGNLSSTEGKRLIGLFPDTQPGAPLLLLLRTPQALTTDAERELIERLQQQLGRPVFSERSLADADQSRWAAQARTEVNLAPLDDAQATSRLQAFLASESGLAGALWIEPQSRSRQLAYRLLKARPGSASNSSGKATSEQLPKALQAFFEVPRTAPKAAQGTAWISPAVPAGARLEQAQGQAWRGLQNTRNEQTADLESAQLRFQRAMDQARIRSEQAQRFSDRFSQDLEDWADDLGDGLSDWADSLNERIDSWQEELGEHVERSIERKLECPAKEFDRSLELGLVGGR